MHYLCDVAIIGGGLAGLTAAHTLNSQGISAKVFEGSDSIGGCVSTCHMADGTAFERGAFSFGNNEKPLWNYVQEFDLPVVEHTDINKVVWFKDWKGTLNDRGSFLVGEEREMPLSQLLTFYLNKIDKLPGDLSFTAALEAVGASSIAIEWLQANTIVGLLGCGLHSISKQAVSAFLQQYAGSTCFYAIKGGNDQLPKAFARTISEHILLQHQVQRVERLKEPCILHGEAFSVCARKVIFAMPVHQLKTVQITPALSQAKQQALSEVYYTDCARLSVIAPPRALDVPPRGGVFLLSDKLGWCREQTLFQNNPEKKTVFNVSLVGKQAEHTFNDIAHWKNSLSAAMSELHPQWTLQPAEYHASFWPLAYAYFMRDLDNVQSTLRQPEGDLHFAGEYTSQEFASMNGAIKSGLRTANEIIEALGKDLLP